MFLFPIDFVHQRLAQLVNERLMAGVIASCQVLVSVHMANRAALSAMEHPELQNQFTAINTVVRTGGCSTSALITYLHAKVQTSEK